jgi:hypothetical protein
MRKLFLVLALAFCIRGVDAHAAIAFVNAADLGNNSGGTCSGFTPSYTITAGSSLIVLVIAGDVGGGNDDITNVTYAGATMTLAVKETSAASTSRLLYLYYLTSPSSGAHNFGFACGSSHYLLAGVAEYSGTATAGQPDATATLQSSSPSTSTLGVTTVAANSWVLTAGTSNGFPGPNCSVGCTQRAVDAAFQTWVLGDSNGSVGASGTNYTETVDFDGTGPSIKQITASFAPPGGGAAAPPTRVLTGVGR